MTIDSKCFYRYIVTCTDVSGTLSQSVYCVIGQFHNNGLTTLISIIDFNLVANSLINYYRYDVLGLIY